MTPSLVNIRYAENGVEAFSQSIKGVAAALVRSSADSLAKTAQRHLEEGAAAKGLKVPKEAVKVVKGSSGREYFVVADFKDAKALEYGTISTLPMRFMRNALKEIFNISNRNNLTRI